MKVKKSWSQFTECNLSFAMPGAECPLTVMQKYEMMEHNEYITMAFTQIGNYIKQISDIGRNVLCAAVGTTVLTTDCNISRHIVKEQYGWESVQSHNPTSLI